MPPLKSAYISPEATLAQWIEQLRARGGPITDLTEGSGARTLGEAFAVVVSGQSQVAASLQLDSYLDTAEGEALDAQGENWQVKRLPAVAAAGKITIKREETAQAASILAGWAQLTVPPAVPGGEGVSVLTTEEAKFSVGQAEAAVSAVALLGGTAGNLQSGTYLTPLSPIVGISSQTGYKVTTTFTGGVNEETDASYRERIPAVVQGRQAKGTAIAYEAFALSVPGVESVSVLKAGYLRSGGAGEVVKGTLEVIYKGAVGLLSSVTAAVASASVLNQEPVTAAAISLPEPRGKRRVVLEATLVVQPGSDTSAFQAEAQKAAMEAVNRAGLGGTAYVSGVIEALHALGNVISIDLPLTKFAIFGEFGAADIACREDQYPELAEADTHLTISEL